MMNEQFEIHEMKIKPSSGEEMKIQKRKGLMYQMTMALCANISVLGPAMGFGYSAVILPILTSDQSDWKLDKNQASWIATAAASGIPIGCLLSTLIMRRGRRLSLIVTSTFSLIGWLLIYMSTNYEKLIVGRVIGGIATGLASVPATVYTAEIAEPVWRSTMVTWSSIGIALGILLVYTFGYFVQENWRLVALLCSLFPATALITTLLAVPESPIWLRERGRIDEARVIMKKFRGIPKNHPITAEIEAELRCTRHNDSTKKQSLMKNIMKRSSLCPFSILLTYFFFQQFSGIFVIVYYAVEIASKAGMQMDKFVGAILIGITRLIGAVIVSYASKMWGRRKPSIASGIGMTIVMGILSIYLYLKNEGYVLNDYGLIPAICLIIYIFMSTIGFLSLPFAMVGEMFPTKVKDALSGLTTCMAYIFSAITIKTYIDMRDLLGEHGVFFFYAIISLLGTIFVIVFLPETKGKTLHDIDVLFSKKRRQQATVEIQIVEKEKMIPLKDMTAA